MNVLIKTTVYTFVMFCIADTFAKNHVEMQTIFYFGMLLLGAYELFKINLSEEK